MYLIKDGLDPLPEQGDDYSEQNAEPCYDTQEEVGFFRPPLAMQVQYRQENSYRCCEEHYVHDAHLLPRITC